MRSVRKPLITILAVASTGIAARAPIALAAERHQERSEAKAETAIEPRALAALCRMGTYLQAQRDFTIRTTTHTDYVLDDNEKVRVNAQGEIHVRRPDRVRAEVVSDRKQRQFFYDGKTFTVFAKNSKLYAVRPAPSTIDSTIDLLYEKFDMELGPGDLLVSNPEKTLTEDAVSGKFVDTPVLDGVKTNHIAVQGNEVDFDLWIADGDHLVVREHEQ